MIFLEMCSDNGLFEMPEKTVSFVQEGLEKSPKILVVTLLYPLLL